MAMPALSDIEKVPYFPVASCLSIERTPFSSFSTSIKNVVITDHHDFFWI